MRIGLTSAAYYGQVETEHALDRIEKLGISCCEVFLETYSEYSGAFGALLAKRLHHTEAVSVHAKSQHFEADFLGQSARQREDAYRMLSGFLDAGQALGAGVYVYHGPANVRGAVPRIERWHEGIACAVEMAAQRGIDLAWETVSWCYLTSPSLVRAFRAQWPTLHFVLDTKQVYELGQDPLDYVDAMGDRLRHVHVLDFDADGRHVLPGKGVHDFRPLARALRETGYQGDVILEPYGSMMADDETLLASINWLRDVFEAT